MCVSNPTPIEIPTTSNTSSKTQTLSLANKSPFLRYILITLTAKIKLLNKRYLVLVLARGKMELRIVLFLAFKLSTQFREA